MAKPTYSHHVDEKPIWVFDNLCSKNEATTVFKGLEASAFRLNEVARPDTAEYKHWAVGLSEPQIAGLPVYQRAMAQIAETTGKKYRAYREFVNLAQYQKLQSFSDFQSQWGWSHAIGMRERKQRYQPLV